MLLLVAPLLDQVIVINLLLLLSLLLPLLYFRSFDEIFLQLFKVIVLLQFYLFLHFVSYFTVQVLRRLLQLLLIFELAVLRFSHLPVEVFHLLGDVRIFRIEAHVQILASTFRLSVIGAAVAAY